MLFMHSILFNKSVTTFMLPLLSGRNRKTYKSVSCEDEICIARVN